MYNLDLGGFWIGVSFCQNCFEILSFKQFKRRTKWKTWDNLELQVQTRHRMQSNVSNYFIYFHCTTAEYVLDTYFHVGMQHLWPTLIDHEKRRNMQVIIYHGCICQQWFEWGWTVGPSNIKAELTEKKLVDFNRPRGRTLTSGYRMIHTHITCIYITIGVGLFIWAFLFSGVWTQELFADSQELFAKFQELFKKHALYWGELARGIWWWVSTG